MTLTDKQAVFVDVYLECWNATEAARRAGYKGNDITLASVGYENLRKPHIVEVVNKRKADLLMSADEALKRISDIGRGKNIDAKPGDILRALELIGKAHNIFSDNINIRVEQELSKTLDYLQSVLDTETYNNVLNALANSGQGSTAETEDT